MSWISVKDRLPEKNKEVFVMMGHRNNVEFACGFVCSSISNFGKWIPSGVYIDSEDGAWCQLCFEEEVTHWMEIPKLK